MCRRSSQIWTDAPAKHSLQSVPLQRPSFTLRAGSSGPCQFFFRTGPSLLVFLVTLPNLSLSLGSLGPARFALIPHCASPTWCSLWSFAFPLWLRFGWSLHFGWSLGFGWSLLTLSSAAFPFPFSFFSFPFALRLTCFTFERKLLPAKKRFFLKRSQCRDTSLWWLPMAR